MQCPSALSWRRKDERARYTSVGRTPLLPKICLAFDWPTQMKIPRTAPVHWLPTTARIQFKIALRSRHLLIINLATSSLYFSRELTTRWLCWLLRFAVRRRLPTSITYSRTERTSTICDDDRPLRRCADRSPRQQWQSAHSAAQHQPFGTRCQRQFCWTVTL